jgi:hypothetical protein
MAVGLIAVPAALALAWMRGISRPIVLGAGVLATAAAVALGWHINDEYLEDRYQAATAPADFPDGVKAALEWFNEEQPENARIAVVGGRPGFKQYVFYGDDLSNHVQYVAHKGAHGAYTPIATDPADIRDFEACEEWRTALNDGDYDYVVIGADQRTLGLGPVEAAWTITTNAFEEVPPTPSLKPTQPEDVFVFRLEGDLDPASCQSDIRGLTASRPKAPLPG